MTRISLVNAGTGEAAGRVPVSDGSGGWSWGSGAVSAWVTKNANYTMLPTDGGVLVTVSSIQTLPASPLVGVLYGVKSAGNGVVPTVSTGTAGVIDAGTINASSVQITEPGACVMFTIAPNGTDWLIVAVSTAAPLTPLAPVPIPPSPIVS